MPGTIWESWDGDATHSDGSKDHPMFSGGIGVWIYKTALGLTFRHAARGGGAGRAASARLRASHLGFDPRAFGLSDADADAALDLAAEVRARATPASLPALAARAGARGVPAARARPALEPVCTLAPDAAVARELRSAAGWRDAPPGRCAARWAVTAGAAGDAGAAGAAGDAVELALAVPAGALGRLALPLALLPARARLSLALDGEELLAGVLRAGAAAGAGAGCVPLGEVEGAPLALCDAALAPRLEALPRAAGAEEVEGEGRLAFGGAAWATGALLFEARAPGEYVLRSTPL